MKIEQTRIKITRIITITTLIATTMTVMTAIPMIARTSRKKAQILDEKNDSDDENKEDDSIKNGISSSHVDFEVALLNENIIIEVKEKLVNDLGGYKNNRYVLLTLIFQLFKQVTNHEKKTHVTCDSLSRILCQVFKSRIFLAKTKDSLLGSDQFRMKFFIKTLIFYAYTIFPVSNSVAFPFCCCCFAFWLGDSVCSCVCSIPYFPQTKKSHELDTNTMSSFFVFLMTGKRMENERYS